MMLRVSDVMRELSISRTAAYQLMHELGPVRFGEHGIRLPAERLKRYIAKQCRGSEVERVCGTPTVTSLTNTASATVANDQHALKTTEPLSPDALPKRRLEPSKQPCRLAKAVERAQRPSDRPMQRASKRSS